MMEIMLVEDDVVDKENVERLLGDQYSLHWINNGEDFLRRVTAHPPDCVLLDYLLPDFDGLELLKQLNEKEQDVAVIVLTGFGNEHIAVEAMKHGASDYLVKNELNHDNLNRAIKYAIENKRIERENRNLEKQLNLSKKLESVGRLASGISHDFNNILMVMNGYCDFALEKLGPAHPAYVDIQEVLKSGTRAASLIRQLLAFCRTQVVQLEPVDLNQLVENLTTMLQPLIGEDIELVVNVCRDLPLIKCDTSQTEQIIVNLVINARDAMPDGGRLIIETSCIDLDENYTRSHIDIQPGQFVQLTVSDNGCGMDENTRAKVFEPFFTTKAVGKGTGLGLSTAYGIIKQIGGTIGVYSEINIGTTFKIYFPVMTGTSEHVAASSISTNRRGGDETIVVVEDDESIQKLLNMFLSELGYTVLVAKNGEEALRYFGEYQHQIQMLLTDVVMPKMSGSELVKILKSQCPELKVIFMSGYTNEYLAMQGTLDNNVDFISKPVMPKDLSRKIREVLDRQ